MNEKVSIIVPIHNAEQTLRRCLDSLRRQAFTNIEVLMVDDGSDDCSGAICAEYESADSRFSAITVKERSGVSNARNLALAQASGDYIAFVDADDHVDMDYIRTLVSVLREHEADVVYTLPLDEDGKTCEVHMKPSYGMTHDVALHPYDFMDEWSTAVVWGAIYTKRAVEGLRFDRNLSIGEDSLFFAECLKRCSDMEWIVTYCSRPIYYYVHNPESAIHAAFSQKKLDELTAWRCICQLWSCESTCAAYALRCMRLCLRNGGEDEFSRFFKPVIREFRNNFPSFIRVCLKRHQLKHVLGGIAFYIAPRGVVRHA
jgi:glycosyltransferase involved in cell wall biosynthesis